jgi:hydroxypyruvate reductase
MPPHLQRHGRRLAIGPVEFDLDTGHPPNGRLFLVSIGKAAVPMAQAAAEILGDAIFAGIGIAKTMPNDQLPIDNFQLTIGEHPVAGEKSVQATTAVLKLLSQTRPGDLVLCLISGGASALFTQPLIPLDEWQLLNRALLASGCTIQEFNTVRRQLDRVKGGGLAQLAAPAQVVSLILSDVIGNDLAAIGSGPTVLTDETPQDALAVLSNYESGIRNYEGGAAVYTHIHHTLAQLPVTQLPNYQLSPPTNLLIGSVRQAAEAARQSAENSGYTATILTAHLEGEAREVGKFAAAIAKELPPGHCAILGGETTVTVHGHGIGGRNLEVALAAAIALDGWPEVAIATFATDGEDGTTGAAGAVVTGETVGNGRHFSLNARQFLDNNDSHTYFQKLDTAGYGPHLLITGPTGTNVNDLIFIIHNS